MREPIQRSLLICFVPRSGSWYVSGLIGNTEVAGWPIEAFVPVYEEDVRQKHGIHTDEEYFDWVIEHSVTDNGTFATKFAWSALQDVLGRLRRIHADEPDDVQLLARRFPNPVFLWLRRRDRVAQAISWARARQTNQWQAYMSPEREPAFDFELIDDSVRLVDEDEAAWAGWFAQNDIAAREVFYEDVLADPRGEVASILEWLGLELPADAELKPYPGFERQADELNEQWAEIYRARLLERQWLPGA
jgi:LPS sulfotransferase NodH